MRGGRVAECVPVDRVLRESGWFWIADDFRACYGRRIRTNRSPLDANFEGRLSG